MASLLSFQSAVTDFVTGTVPRSTNIYTVPVNTELILTGSALITQAQSGDGSPTVTIGNSDNASAYQTEVGSYNYDNLPTFPQIPATTQIPAGTTITATITANSISTSHTGFVAVLGYLVATGGSDNSTLPPTPSDVIGFLYLLTPGGSPISGATVIYAMVVSPAGAGSGWNSSPQTVTSDDTGLITIPIEAGASYQIWSGMGDPTVVAIPNPVASPFALPTISIGASA